MPTCEDQDWDSTVVEAEATLNGTGAPRLKRSPFPAIPAETQAFTSLSLVTDQSWPTVPALQCGAHNSMAVSSPIGGLNCMPTAATGGGAATSPEQAHLFEAYVQAFCELGAP